MAPTPVFLLEKPHRQRSLVGYNLWDCKEPDATEYTWRLYPIFLSLSLLCLLLEGQVDLYNLLECGEESEEWTQTASKKQE